MSGVRWIWVVGLTALMLMAATAKVSLFEKGKRPLQGVNSSTSFSTKHHSLSAKQCKKCHQKIYKEWRRSRHASALTNQIFSVAFQHSPYRWCVHCHAPLPEQLAQLRSQLPYYKAPHPKVKANKQARSLLQEGVNCAACHIRKGRMLSSRPPSVKARKSHPGIQFDRRLKRATFCAGCHQFNFTHKLTEPHRPTSVPTQNTYEEWKRSYARKKGKVCQSCHMRKGSHRFPGGHSKAFLKRAIKAKLRMLSKRKIQVHLTSQKVGHAVPTGDPFRRLRLQICADAFCKKLLVEKLLRRTFGRKNGQWHPLQDTRIPAPTHTKTGRLSFHLTLPKARTSVYWQLHLLYAEYQHHRYLVPSDISTRIVHGRLALPTQTKSKR